MKRQLPVFITLFAGLILATSHLLAEGSLEKKHNMETLYGIRLHTAGLEVRVKSHGCTEPEHFEVETMVSNDKNLLTVVRKKPDRCRKMPRIIHLNLEFPHTEKTLYQLVNPLQSG